MNYGLPVIRRRGLGNELFAWARCVVWCRESGAKMFRARWGQVHVGPYLRLEHDKRQYQQLFQVSGQESWAKIPWLVARGYRFRSEDELTTGELSNRAIVTFDGMKSHFHSLWNKHDLVLSELKSAARAQVISSLPVLPTPHIGVHVRHGDFAPGTTAQLLGGVRNTRIPQRWYIEAVQQVRQSGGEQLVAYVYSDGSDDDLAELLAMPGVQRMPRNNALTDMLSLSRASAVVSSGSTFSAWASFLRQSPTVCHRGQIHYPTRPAMRSEVEWMPGERISAQFVIAVGHRLRSASAGHASSAGLRPVSGSTM